jgi:FtsP/CotA-like multicopper oxidase with cupredoxin domain
MSRHTDLQRRNFLKYSSLAASAMAFPSLLNATMNAKSNRANPNFHPDVEIELTQRAIQIPIFNGPETRIWKVFGKVLNGPASSVDNFSDTYLAPTLRFNSGQKVRIYLHNQLPAQSILHWHGLHVPADMDGNPLYAINQGETYVYEFEVLNRAGTYWYHAHTHSVTAKQVYSGLAGLIIVNDQQEQVFNLPTGEYDIPLVIQDRSFDSNNQLQYSTHMMQRMRGFLGDQIFVNGQPNFELAVANRAYRLRLLNGSNSRIYKLAWDDATPMIVIGTDGGLLEQPQQVPYLMLAPGQRRELWVDFSHKEIGSQLTLRSTSFAGASMHGGGMMGRMGGGMMGGRRGMGMGGGMMRGSSLPPGGDYPIMPVKVVKKARDNAVLPKRFAPIKPLELNNAANANNPRTITLSMRHMSALLNGRSYKMNDVRPDEVIPVNSLQLMAFDNGLRSSHGMMAMPHPMHLHGEQFKIVKRELNPAFRHVHNTVKDGLVDNGLADTVLVMPGEKVTFLKPFNDFTGLFMYHCHNLEHEDMGMMRDFLIK